MTVMPHHDALIEQGVQLHRSRRFREAEYVYQSVLRENPRHPDAVNLMGVLAIEAGQNSIALDYLREAVRLAPKQAIYRNNLGNALIIAGQFEEALPHLRRAVTLDPNYAEAWCNTGKAWRMIGDREAAEKYFRKTLTLSPGFLRAQAGLAEIESEMGRFEQAALAFEKILDLDPRNVDALCGIVQTRKFAEKDPIIPLFMKVLRDPALRDDQRAPLHHAFAKICNDVGLYADAFKHFARGKELKKLKFHMELHRETYAAARKTFTREFFASRKHYGIRDGRPIFIVGMPRSGTTLTEQILASHPLVTGLGELPDMRRLARALGYGSAKPEDFTSNVEKLEWAGTRELVSTYLRAFSRAEPGQIRLIDKSPHNYETLGLITLLFPNARIIHCRRNPLDNCVACYMQNFSESHGYNGDLAVLGAYYREYEALMEHWRQVLPNPMIEINYEDMVTNQEATTRRLVYLMGLEWSDECLRFFDLERQVRTPSRWQVRQPMYSSSVGRWKRYDTFLGPLKTALGIGVH